MLKIGTKVIWIVCFLLFISVTTGSAKELLLKLDFEEEKDFLGKWRNAKNVDISKSATVFIQKSENSHTGRSAARYVINGQGRIESASQRLPVNSHLVFEWHVFIPKDIPLGTKGTVSQILGRQSKCMEE